MNLDQPWKIAALIGLLASLRAVWGAWRGAPARRTTLELLDSGLIAFVLVFALIRPFVVQSFYIPTGSMEPTLMGAGRGHAGLSAAAYGLRQSKQGDRILVNRFIYRLNSPQRGDIIVFRAPPQALIGEAQGDFVKRLIGLPGDVIQIKRGDGVYVNGRRLEEPRTVAVPEYDWPVDASGRRGSYRVPEGCYFVLGDNRNRSYDSHLWTLAGGAPHPELEAGRVVGKALFVFWPPARVGLIGDHRGVHLRPQEADTVASSSAAELPLPRGDAAFTGRAGPLR
jgi:signal peptidase I